MATQKAICKQCGAEFTARIVSTQPWRGQFCRLACFHQHNVKYPIKPQTCPSCDQEFMPNRTQARALATGEQKMIYCSSTCYRNHLGTKRRGSGNGHWKGGVIESNGYIYHRQQRHAVSPYVAEHQLIAEQVLGRPLEPGEIPHHKNEDKGDNRPDNIEVLTRSEHMRLHATRRATRRG